MKILSGCTAEWPAISGLLDEALALPRADRERWLQALPEKHAALRDLLRGLLATDHEVESTDFLDSLPPISGLAPPAPELAAGDIVGPYRVLREIGTGGMGAVWLAERADGVLKRQIALKLPRMAWMAGLAERMERERDILSSLEHSNIARLYDAGVDQHGRPFLAIEYIQGERIDDYCDQRRLGVRDRIVLFLQVLEAVRYAHSHLVIHRDLKPANVLVNLRDQAQLLDFGIARLQDGPGEKNSDLGRRKTITDIAARAMTLRYASPEQVQARPLSVATDVYSLGVMLYELLTDASPYVTRNGTSAEIETAIAESQLRLASRVRIDETAAAARASTPSKISRMLRGDLDAVLLRALARDVHERFASVDAFHQDLSRWLAGQPVSAQPASRLYVLRKFVVRHRWPVALGASAILAIIAVGIVAVLLAVAAREESRKATAARDFMLDLFEQANPELHGGRDITARQLLIDSEAQISGKLDAQPSMRADVLMMIAALWERLGDTRRARTMMAERARILTQSGDSIGAVAARIDEATRAIAAADVTHARRILQELPLGSGDGELPMTSRIDLRLNRAWVALNAGAIADADRNFGLALELARASNNVDRQLIALFGRIRTAWSQGDVDESRRNQRAAAALLDAPGLTPASRLGRGAELAEWAYRLGDYREAWPRVQRLIAESTRLYGSHAPSQNNLHLQWLRFAWRMQDTDAAVAWMRIEPVDMNGMSVAVDRIERRVVEASVWRVAGDGERVRATLDAAWAEVDRLPSAASRERSQFVRRLALAEAALSLQSGDPVVAVHWLDDQVWRAARGPDSARRRDAATATRILDDWVRQARDEPQSELTSPLLAYRWFSLALSAEGLGRTADAKLLLARASKVAEQAIGMDHPDTSLMAVNDLLFTIRNNRREMSRNDHYLKRTEELLEKLRRSFPEEHTALRKLRWLRQRLHEAPDRPPLEGVARALEREVTDPERLL